MSRLTQTMHPPYHLRPNKAIDRSIFLELLHVLDSYHSLNNYIYIGFGGPFLEDFRLVANDFPHMHMMSVEKDKQTHKRQLFHKCTSNIKPFLSTFESFLSIEFPSDCPTITWADYNTDLSRKLLLEASDIVRKAIPLSVVRITVNAETPVYNKLHLRRKPVSLPRNKRGEFEYFLSSFRSEVNIHGVAYDEDLFKWENFTEENYPNLLLNIISTVMTAACSRPKTYLPLHSVKYSDGTIMLSITGIICQEKEKDDIVRHFKARCEFVSSDYNTAETIDVPFLTTKERLHLECEIPVAIISGKITCDRLGYLIEGDGSDDFSKYKMHQYEKYHRLYPYFGKLIP